ncbi:unnamed protein product [Microthlaspi erraticum]|uniref:NB-ARC domain-containing protein n=1 Tax=Microthlaspi erraticum TaxID=1685480 RepID=A0A6D2HD59_9BRAS|nr:unnamed protein product [Microthlaspi erraticum]CAA7033850.1 unnamed protein product [Microthlaspi erraticum]
MMAPESTSHSNGLDKGDSTRHFVAKYEEWIHKSIPESLVMEEDRVETESALSENEIFGFKNEIKSLENFLLDRKVYKEFKSLVVLGEYGVGKTTLCQMVFNNEDVKSVYAPRIWISMYSKEKKEGEDNKVFVLKRILKGLGVEDSIYSEVVEDAAIKQEAGEIIGETAKEKELSALLYVLNLNLKWKKYLIVFDDVREEDNWNEMLRLDEDQLKVTKWGTHLSDGFPKGSGGRVISTTRDKSLADKLVAKKHEIHSLWPLSDPQSVWKIYEAEVIKKGKELPRNDKKCIDELMNKSRGLPLAAILMAKLDPVFVDDENTEQNGSRQGPTDPDSI